MAARHAGNPMERYKTMTGKAIGIGVGPGDPELMTLKGARILSQSTVVAYPAPEEGDSLARRIAAPHLPDNATEIVIRMPLSAPKFPDDKVYGEAAVTLKEHLTKGRDVAVLCEGDPFFYGSFMYLFSRLAADYKVEVVPGVSSPMACAAVLGTPLAAQNDVLTILPGPLDTEALRSRLEATDAAAIIKLGRHFPRIRALLEDMDLIAQSRYVERATMDAERIVPLDEVDPTSSPYFSMILVHRRGQAWLR